MYFTHWVISPLEWERILKTRSLLWCLISWLFSCSVMSNSLRPHGLQHARLPCPSPTPGACSNSCPSSLWCHATISFILCRPLLLPSIFPSIKVFSKESVICIRWPKYCIFSFSISPSNGYSRLISFRMGWLDLLTVQGTLKSLLQHHSWKASIRRHSALFKVQLSHPYMTTGKPTALTRWTFVSFLICCLGLSQFFFQGASYFTFVAGNHLLEISLILYACSGISQYLREKSLCTFH